ncbi:MAG: transposase [Desulfomonilaceae bacterium]
MGQVARVVVPCYPHHITQRGNRRQQTSFCGENYRAYIDLMSEWCSKHGVDIWAYCLMPNHVHLIAVPQSIEGLARAIGEAHRRYTRRVNFLQGWRGLFASYVLDEANLITAARYVELNPVRARLVRVPGEYLWSSAAAHIAGQNDDLVKVAPLLGMVGGWSAFLAEETATEHVELLRLHERTGRPLGSDEFIGHPEKTIGRRLRRKRPGPKRTIEGN